MAFPSYDRLLFVRMESYERGVENSPMDQGSTGTPHMSVTRTDCAHLSDPEWEALQRLSQVIGEAAVATMLRTLSPTEQHGVALGYIVKEQRDVAASVASPKPRVESLKLHVSTYTGKEDETLLRWLVELDTAVAARRIVDPMSKVAFAMSCLGGQYPNTLEEAISLAMQEEFSRRQAKLHANAPRPARSVAKTGGPEPMDLSSATTAGQQQRRYGKVRCYKCSNIGHYARECMAGGRAGRPTGDAVSRVELGHATLRTAAPSEKVSRCDMQDDKPNLVILNVMTFVEDLIVLDLDDKFDLVLGMPWLARHDPVINWEKRTLVRFNNIRATESDGPVSATHAPDGACGVPVEAAAAAAASDHRRRPSTTPGVVERKCVSTQKSEPKGRGHMSDGQVNAIHLREGIIPVLPVSLEVLQAPKGRADDVASTPGVDEANKIRGTERRASAPGADATMCTSEYSLALKASESTSTPGVDDADTPSTPGVDGGAAVLGTDCAAGGAGGCKRPAPEQPACSRAAALHAMSGTQAGLECASQRKESADDYCDNVPSKVRCLGRGAPGAGLQGRPSRRKLRELRESQSGTETGVSAVQTPSVETLNVLTRTGTGLQYQRMRLENPPTSTSALTALPTMSWKRFTRDLYDGRIEQICILSDVERVDREAEELKQLVYNSIGLGGELAPNRSWICASVGIHGARTGGSVRGAVSALNMGDASSSLRGRFELEASGTSSRGRRDPKGGSGTYLFREYPNTLEEAISLAMQEEFSRRQAKLHANAPRPARSVAKTGGPEPMDLSSATTAGQQQLHGGRAFKKRQEPVGAGRPTGDAVSRVELGHATLRTAAPSEKVSRCDMQDDKPNLVILNVITFVEGLIVLDLDDKFDLVLGMPWLARHDPVINWEKRTLVRFNNIRATESDGPVSATHAPDVDDADTPSTPGVDGGAAVLGTDCAAGGAGGCKRPAPEQPACSRAAALHAMSGTQAGLECASQRKESADDYCDNVPSKVRCLGRGAPGAGLQGRPSRRKLRELRESQSGTETGVSAVQTPSVETLNVLTRTGTGLQYQRMRLENPPTSTSALTALPTMSWKRFTRDLYDGRIEQICILSDVERVDREAEELKQLVSTSLATSSSLILLHEYNSIGFGGELAPNRSWICASVGIHGARTGGSVRGAVSALNMGDASSSLRGRFELEASGTSSRGRRDPKGGSGVSSDEDTGAGVLPSSSPSSTSS
ncbi:hypothetical protein P3T76_001641 [Phytophthora citrophthora]|uniref:CCHC-type domain-containing protein n=1 Tax=Phytophthora citrophthora TaxID=4793 RepID=A0AAD9LT29_9STRA|nr:hypothetical protein P3T76_001641 [Phytophthora citrophthora]